MDKDGDVTTYEYNELNQLVSAGDIEYTWDNAGNLVSQTTTSGVIVATYTYDSYNRMVSASVNSNSGTLEQEYTYDYLGNRTSKTTDGVTTYYVKVNDFMVKGRPVSDLSDSEFAKLEVIAERRFYAFEWMLSDEDWDHVSLSA